MIGCTEFCWVSLSFFFSFSADVAGIIGSTELYWVLPSIFLWPIDRLSGSTDSAGIIGFTEFFHGLDLVFLLELADLQVQSVLPRCTVFYLVFPPDRPIFRCRWTRSVSIECVIADHGSIIGGGIEIMGH